MDHHLYILCLVGFLMLNVMHVHESVATKSDQVEQSNNENGVHGCTGVPGRDGRDGRDGIQGPYGPPGSPGDSGLSAELETKFKKLLTSVEQLRNTVENGLDSPQKGLTAGDSESIETNEGSTLAGATYVRWGRNVCPQHARKLYSGFVAGSHYTHTGSGANHLCLPSNPQWNRTVAGLQDGGRLYGTEFEISTTNSGFHRGNSGGILQNQHDAQCAVCQTPGRMNQLMIPARLECPSGWSLEYLGFLMSGHYTHKRSEFVCVDQDPDVHAGTSVDKNGNLFYIVEVSCGALPCPPYVEGYEVTCVVCTQ